MSIFPTRVSDNDAQTLKERGIFPGNSGCLVQIVYVNDLSILNK